MRRSKSFHPTLESLEARSCPTTMVSFNPATHVLSVTGDTGPNAVTITQNDTTDNLSLITFDELTQSIPGPPGFPGLGFTRQIPVLGFYGFTSSTVRQVNVSLGDGADSVAYSLRADTR